MNRLSQTVREWSRPNGGGLNRLQTRELLRELERLEDGLLAVLGGDPFAQAVMRAESRGRAEAYGISTAAVGMSRVHAVADVLEHLQKCDAAAGDHLGFSDALAQVKVCLAEEKREAS